MSLDRGWICARERDRARPLIREMIARRGVCVKGGGLAGGVKGHFGPWRARLGLKY